MNQHNRKNIPPFCWQPSQMSADRSTVLGAVAQESCSTVPSAFYSHICSGKALEGWFITACQRTEKPPGTFSFHTNIPRSVICPDIFYSFSYHYCCVMWSHRRMETNSKGQRSISSQVLKQISTNIPCPRETQLRTNLQYLLQRPWVRPCKWKKRTSAPWTSSASGQSQSHWSQNSH